MEAINPNRNRAQYKLPNEPVTADPSSIDAGADGKIETEGTRFPGHRNILSQDSMSNFNFSASDALTFKELAEEEEKLASKLAATATQSDLEANADNRFISYVDVRENCHAYWFIDGKDYFTHLADSLEKAEVCNWPNKYSKKQEMS